MSDQDSTQQLIKDAEALVNKKKRPENPDNTQQLISDSERLLNKAAGGSVDGSPSFFPKMAVGLALAAIAGALMWWFMMRGA